MILISSIAEDMSTSEVIDWLVYYKASFTRINDDEKLTFSVKLGKSNLIYLNRPLGNVCLKEVKSYWYRRGDFIPTQKYFEHNNNVLTSELNEFYGREAHYTSSFIHHFISANIKSINSYKDNYINKVKMLEIATTCGLKIPETIITQDRRDLLQFSEQHEYIIIKAIAHTFSATINDQNIYANTLLFHSSEIREFPETFNLLLAQKQIPKKYELRVFYLNGEFFASAIFSQNDEMTKIDFRNYNKEKPNRVIPYILPKDIRKKLNKLMKTVKLSSGSFDLIVDTSNDIIFLEVNPIGQFKQVSYPCNYYLEEKIAKKLIDYAKR